MKKNLKIAALSLSAAILLPVLGAVSNAQVPHPNWEDYGRQKTVDYGKIEKWEKDQAKRREIEEKNNKAYLNSSQYSRLQQILKGQKDLEAKRLNIIKANEKKDAQARYERRHSRNRANTGRRTIVIHRGTWSWK